MRSILFDSSLEANIYSGGVRSRNLMNLSRIRKNCHVYSSHVLKFDTNPSTIDRVTEVFNITELIDHPVYFKYCILLAMFAI